MPLEQRLIEPLYICRDNLPSIPNPVLVGRELECINNGSMANVIRQLSCLAFYAEDIFGGIVNESTKLQKKTEKLQKRINKLNEEALNLDFQQEEVSFVDVDCNELFNSSFSYDQEVLSRQTMPNSLLRKYQMCDKAPQLQLLNPYRDDGNDAMKFYTNPNFFFELWRNAMLKQVEKEKFSKKMISNNSLNTTKQIKESYTVKKSKRPRKPENTNEKYRRMMSQQGEFFVDSNLISENQQGNYSNDYSPYGTIEIRNTDNTKKKQQIASDQVDGKNSFLNETQIKPIQQFRLNDPQTILQTSSQKENTNHVRFNQTPIIIPNSPIMMNKNDQSRDFFRGQQQNNQTGGQINTNLPDLRIPTPPPMPNNLLNNDNSINLNNNITKNSNDTAKTPATTNQATSLAQEILIKQQQLRSAPTQPKPVSNQIDARSTLLASIREGIKLRSVQQRQQKTQIAKDDNLKDVASILQIQQRRIAMQLSDSESNHSNNESDDDDWLNE